MENVINELVFLYALKYLDNRKLYCLGADRVSNPRLHPRTPKSNTEKCYVINPIVKSILET